MHSSCYTTARHQLIHRRLGVKPSLFSSIPSVCSHYFPTCHLLLTYLKNSSLIQFSLQRWFLKHLFETTSHNDINSHVAKHHNCAYLFSCNRREHSILSTICSCQDQLLLFKLVNLWQVDFTVRMCRCHPD